MKRFFITIAALLLTAGQAWSASCQVVEFDILPIDAASRVMMIPLSYSGGNTTQVDTSITIAEDITDPMGVNTRYVWIFCDEIVHVLFGISPAASLTVETGMRIPDGGFWFGLPAGPAKLGTLEVALCDVDCT